MLLWGHRLYQIGAMSLDSQKQKQQGPFGTAQHPAHMPGSVLRRQCTTCRQVTTATDVEVATHTVRTGCLCPPLLLGSRLRSRCAVCMHGTGCSMAAAQQNSALPASIKTLCARLAYWTAGCARSSMYAPLPQTLPNNECPCTRPGEQFLDLLWPLLGQSAFPLVMNCREAANTTTVL